MGAVVPSFSPGDFGKAAEDYAAYRKGFPDSFFQRLLREGIGKAGQRILDLGTGTGTLARGFARQGATVTGMDISHEMLQHACKLGVREGAPAAYVLAKSEAVPLASGSFDVITAGSCWHWFDGAAAAKECRRLLKPGGLLIIAHFSYLAQKGNAAGRTEDLILERNPTWPLAGSDGRCAKWSAHMESAGFKDIREDFYDEPIPWSHEEWRGRIRACNGVLALGMGPKIQEFDRDLATLLREEFPGEPMWIPHRICMIRGSKK